MDKKRKNVLLALTGIMLLLFFIYMITDPLPLTYKSFLKREIVSDGSFSGIALIKFNRPDDLKDWQEKIIKGETVYSIKSENGKRFLNAYSKNSASGLLYWLNFDPREKPFISWKWKVVRFPEKKAAPEASEWIEKEDYAARFYVIFPRFPFFRMECLEYVWDKDLPKETVFANPYFKNLKIIVAESGEDNLGKWVTIERNIYDDFKKIFGKAPGPVGAIAIMTDSENSSSTAQAEYDEVRVGYEK